MAKREHKSGKDRVEQRRVLSRTTEYLDALDEMLSESRRAWLEARAVMARNEVALR